MAKQTNYTDIVHERVSEADAPLKLEDLMAILSEQDSPPKNPRSTVRGILRTSGMIMPTDKEYYGWMPRLVLRGRFRHTLTDEDFEKRSLVWDHDLRVALWPSMNEPEKRRDLSPVTLVNSAKHEFVAELAGEGGFRSPMDTEFWAWLSEAKAAPGWDLIFTAPDEVGQAFMIRLEPRADRQLALIKERNQGIKRRMKEVLSTKRGQVAPPAELAALLVAAGEYRDSVPPQSLSNLLTEAMLESYGRAVPFDDLEQAHQGAKVIPFPKQGHESAEMGGDVNPAFELEVPRHTGRELPDMDALVQAEDAMDTADELTPALAIHALNVSRLATSAYAFLSRTTHHEDEGLNLAGQAVVAAERRLAHQILEGLITGAELDIEAAVENYLGARIILARSLWIAHQEEAAIEQAIHCFEIAPEEPMVREDLFHMLMESGRSELMMELMARFETEDKTEVLFHRAYVMLMEDPESKEGTKALRKAVKHNPYLASLLLGETPKKGKKSSKDQGEAYDLAYGHLWRREDFLFDLLEETVLARN